MKDADIDEDSWCCLMTIRTYINKDDFLNDPS